MRLHSFLLVALFLCALSYFTHHVNGDEFSLTHDDDESNWITPHYYGDEQSADSEFDGETVLISLSSSTSKKNTNQAKSTTTEEGDWTEAPPWWQPPPEENVAPWSDDFYAHLVKPMAIPQTTYALNAAHKPFGAPALFGAVPGGVGSQPRGFVKGPGVPPLAELDANMQPANNFPNPPFYEHDYSADYIWS